MLRLPRWPRSACPDAAGRRPVGWQVLAAFAARRGSAFTPLLPTPESALMLLILSLFRIRRTAASSYARKPRAGARRARTGRRPQTAAPHDGAGSSPPRSTVRLFRTVQLLCFLSGPRRAVRRARFVVPRARPAGFLVQPEHVPALSFP